MLNKIKQFGRRMIGGKQTPPATEDLTDIVLAGAVLAKALPAGCQYTVNKTWAIFGRGSGQPRLERMFTLAVREGGFNYIDANPVLNDLIRAALQSYRSHFVAVTMPGAVPSMN